MIEIQKVQECLNILNAGEKGVLDEVFERMKTIGADGKILCERMEALYDIPHGTWRPWAVANLSASEKAWLIARYQELKIFLNAIA